MSISIKAQLFVIAFTVLASSNATARQNVDSDIERDWSRSIAADQFSAEGILQCENVSHGQGQPCQLKFVRLSDKQEFRLDANRLLNSVHCDDHKDVVITANGRFVQRQLFGPDLIAINSFKIIKKMDADEVKKLLAPRKSSNRRRLQLELDIDHQPIL